MKKLLLIVSLVVAIGACQNGPTEGSPTLYGAQSLLWAQFSAEAEALYLQGYGIASERARAFTRAEGAFPPAVVLDIDETVLDNSPFNVHLLRAGKTFSPEEWADWCERREAEPLPGALAFTRLADSLGISVFYVSNRTADLLGATLDNLAAYGFPHADSAHVLLKTVTSSKDERRAQIASEYDIILLLGDNLGDFNGIFDDRANDFGKPHVRSYAGEFGKRYIIFPNSFYGSWERGVSPDMLKGY